MRASILVAAAAVSVASLDAWTISARAEDGVEGAVSLELRVAHSDVYLGNASFDGVGGDAAGYVRSVSATGAQLGIVRPNVTFYDGAFSAHVGGAHDAQFSLAIVLGGGATSTDAAPTDPATAARIDGDFHVLRGGLELGVGSYLGPLPLYVQASTFFGGASIWTSVNDLSACAVRGCSGDLYAAHGYVQPRATIQLELPIFTLGAYVGDNLVHTQEIETGFTIGVRLWSARAKSDFDLREALHL